MKGYLQRIAANAARPEGNIHPHVGGMFQVKPREEIIETRIESIKAEKIDEHNVNPQPNLFGVPKSAVAASVSLPPNKADKFELADGATGIETSEFVSFSNPHQVEYPESRVQEQEKLAATQSDSPVLNEQTVYSHSLLLSGLPKTVQEQEKLAATQSDSPVLNEQTVHLHSLLLSDLPKTGEYAEPVASQQVQSMSDVRSTNRQYLERSAVAKAEPLQDIQIHIGRIEVVAMPQPVRTVASAPRKTTSLDEYLSKHDGRAR